MNRIAKEVIFFGIGSLAGFLLTRKLLTEKYLRIAQEEIDSVKAHFSFRKEKTEKETEKETQESAKEEFTNYHQYAEDLGYRNKGETIPSVYETRPRVISPEEFGDQDGYDQISLTYYSDKTLTDDRDRAMDENEIDDTVGKENLNRFGEYEPDSVFVRNDRLKADYEILLDARTYAEVLQEKPYLIQ